MAKWFARQLFICLVIIALAYPPRFPNRVRNWCTTISKYSAEHNLDPNLIAALILVESNGDPNAISTSGAVGLMQVMPSDGKASSFMCTNGPFFAGRPTTKRLLDPEFNIKYGTRMLAQLIEREGGK